MKTNNELGFISKDGKRALYEGEAEGGTPYVTTISSWSSSGSNYYKRITATTHGKGYVPKRSHIRSERELVGRDL